MILSAIALDDLIQLANEGLLALSALLGLSAGIVAWWFILKD